MEIPSNEGFSLIWLYWIKKYLRDTPADGNSLAEVKKNYQIETVEGFSSQAIDQKVSFLKEMSSRRLVYVVDPEKELKSIEEIIKKEPNQIEMINQLYSYYLNSQNVFIIYRNESSSNSSRHNLCSLSSENEANVDNISDCQKMHHLAADRDNRTEGNNKPLGKLNSSDILHNKLYQDDSNECRNDSLLDIYDKIQHKIEGLQILDKLAEFDSTEIFNCKFKNIPHTFLKIKHPSWAKCVTLPIMHPSQPKVIAGLPIVPRLSKLKPSIDKLLPFVSYLKLLDKESHGLSPTVESIFEYNHLPYVFAQEHGQANQWSNECSLGMLCYFVVFGNDGYLTVRRAERWAEQNSSTLLGKTIKDMNRLQRERVKARREHQHKTLLLLDCDGEQEIW